MKDANFLISDKTLLRYTGGEERVRIPEGIKVIGEYAFARCDSVTEIILPDGVEVISEHAFMECGWLKEISLPTSLKYIGEAAFRSCDSLESIDIPDSVRELPAACFYECLSLRTVKLPESAVRICSRAFSGCPCIESIRLPYGVEEIEEFAFEYCTVLKRIDLPDSLEFIGRHAFACCHELADIKIPESVKHIGSSAFYQTAFLENSDGRLLIGGDGILINCGCKDEQVTLPPQVKSIGELAFAYNDHVKKVLLPDGLREISDGAFERCSSLTEISLPDSLVTIGDRAFEDCALLSDIAFSDGVENIGAGAFERTAAAACGGELLLGGKYFIRPRGGRQTPIIPETAEVIAGGAFKGDTDIRSVTLGGKLRSVCKEAFRWCRDLKEVHITADVKYLGEYAFAGCGELHAYIERCRRMVGECCFEEGQLITFFDGGESFTAQLQNDLTANSPEHALFAFAAEPCEERFAAMQLEEYMLPAAVCYAPLGGVYEQFLRENITAAVRMAVDRADSELLRRVLEYNFLTERQAAECAAYAIDCKALEQQIMIMRFKQDTFGSVCEDTIDGRFDW